MTRDRLDEILLHQFSGSRRTVDWWWTVKRESLGGCSAEELWDAGLERTVVTLALKGGWSAQ